MSKRAAVINDLSGFGKCSLSAAIAVLSAIGVQPCPIPTAILTNQTGFNLYKCVDFTEHLADYLNVWKKNKAEFDGIYSGYIANSKQVDFIADFIDTFRKENTIVLVDPVMGDNGIIYKEYSKEMCDKIIKLAAKADFITPNLTELCILSNKKYSEISKLPFDRKIIIIKETASTLAAKNNQIVAVTGIVDKDRIYNCILGKETEFLCSTKYYNMSFSGTGDLFSSTFFGNILQGKSVSEALVTASGFIEKCVSDTVGQTNIDPNHGVEFEKNLRYLLSDM